MKKTSFEIQFSYIRPRLHSRIVNVAGICSRECKHITAPEQVTLPRPLAVQESSVAGQWPCSQLLSLYCCRDGISCSIHMQSAAHCSAMLHISSSHLWLQKWMVDNIHHKVCNSCCRQSRQTNSHSSVTRPLMRIYWRADGIRSVGLQSVLLHITSYLTPRVLPWPRKPRLDQYLLSSCSSIPRPDFTNKECQVHIHFPLCFEYLSLKSATKHFVFVLS